MDQFLMQLQIDIASVIKKKDHTGSMNYVYSTYIYIYFLKFPPFFTFH